MRKLVLVLILVFSAAPASAALSAVACTAYLSPGQPLPAWVAPGTVLCLHGGDYPHDLLRINANSATYQTAPGELTHARLVGPGIEAWGHDFTLADLNIDNAGAGIPALVLRGANDTVSGVELSNGRYSGIDVRGVGATISNNLIHNFDSGIAGTDANCINVINNLTSIADGLVVSGNIVHDCSGDGIQVFFDNVSAAPVARPHWSIRGNTFYRGTRAYSENAIDTKIGGGEIENNIMWGYGISDTAQPNPPVVGGNPILFLHKLTAGVRVAGNTFRDSSKAVKVFGFSGADSQYGPRDILITGNTFQRIGAPGYSYVFAITGTVALTITHNALIANTAPLSDPPSLAGQLALDNAPDTATPTNTATATQTPSATSTASPTNTPTVTPTVTPTPIPTGTPTPIESQCDRLTYWDGRVIISCPGS